MTQRTRTRETDTDVSDLLNDIDGGEGTEATSSESYTTRAKKRAGNLFSVRYFGLATLLLGVAMFFGGVIPILGSVAGLVAVFAVSFVLGAVTSDSKIVETAVAGGIAGGVVFALKNIVALSVAGFPIFAIGLVAGLVAGGLGAYFGGDLRDGLTKDL
ncbi:MULTISPECIES: hypothetical protein [unclassified Haladaptatus]|uniref:hypothetical protein n=1 Tax=unclassified Haladaptatus TaxID=2622732 RepID=UPI00209C4D26|nr:MULTISPECIES: hypothetical protein [unclassified Haladaptatus]MCO8242903.1 hypothetical protein [Haladaptatus sp. AB643]MCO8252660.1 hypothetical protein [Haladaptatus sp. AB618]